MLIATFGNEANAAINGLTLTVTPYETADRSIVWRCGTAPAPAGGLALPALASGRSRAPMRD